MRKVRCSEDKKVKILSKTPYDRYNCECIPLVENYIKKRAKGMKPRPVTCPRDKTGMKHYNIICNNCGAVLAQVWSTDKKMSDWCDLKYITESDGKEWKGCMALNISQIDGKLGIECTCGQDTRDFRASLHFSQKNIKTKENNNSKGRSFGDKSSKFKLEEIK